MTIAILDPCAEDRARVLEALAGAVEGPFLEIDPARWLPDETIAGLRLVLVETDLPGDSGFGLLARLHLPRPDLPIVVVTRRVEPDRIVAAMKAGACDHVGKDRLERLPPAVREALSRPGAADTQARLFAALRSAREAGHDLRNVFQSIRLAMDLLRRIPDEARRVPLLDTVATAIARGRDLLDRMLTVARADETPAPIPREPVLPAERSGVILIIDEDPDICEWVRLAIGERGYRTLTVNDRTEALSTFDQHQHDIAAVIVDTAAQSSGGPSLIRDLRLKRPTMPILPTGSPSALVTLDESSLRYFLLKPFTASALLETLERLLAEEPRSWPAS